MSLYAVAYLSPKAGQSVDMQSAMAHVVGPVDAASWWEDLEGQGHPMDRIFGPFIDADPMGAALAAAEAWLEDFSGVTS